ncbi:MAG: hypothetical protein ACRC10_10515 [Thermoguttaceae bacterium]
MSSHVNRLGKKQKKGEQAQTLLPDQAIQLLQRATTLQPSQDSETEQQWSNNAQ